MIEQIVSKESIFFNEYKGDTEVIENHINHILSFDKGRIVSNRGGYQSNFITFGFEDLIKFAIDSFKAIDLNAQLNSFWLNVNKGENYNKLHVHGLYDWSVIYYHKVCCEKSTTNFHHLVPAVKEDVFRLKPVERRMVFFNGMLPHSVSPCGESNHERITLAFNFSILK